MGHLQAHDLILFINNNWYDVVLVLNNTETAFNERKDHVFEMTL